MERVPVVLFELSDGLIHDRDILHTQIPRDRDRVLYELRSMQKLFAAKESLIFS